MLNDIINSGHINEMYVDLSHVINSDASIPIIYTYYIHLLISFIQISMQLMIDLTVRNVTLARETEDN